MDEIPLVNGINYAWVNITLILAGVMVRGFTKITYKVKQDKKNNYGAGSKPISRGYGNIEYEGSIELYTDEIKRIIAGAPNRSLLEIPPFNILVVFGGSSVTADQDTLIACEFTEDAMDAAQGATSLKVNLPLVIGDVKR